MLPKKQRFAAVIVYLEYFAVGFSRELASQQKCSNLLSVLKANTSKLAICLQSTVFRTFDLT